MKKIIAYAFTFCSMVFASSAFASQTLMTCALDFDIQGGGIQIGIGIFDLEGPGKIECIAVDGTHESMDINVKMGGKYFGPAIAIAPYMRLQGVAKDFGIDFNPEALLGDYLVAGISGTVGIGVGASFTIENPKKHLDIGVAVSEVEGLGIGFGLSNLEITQAINL